MNALKALFLLMLIPSFGLAAETAGYYRLWQGFKRPEFSQAGFQSELPAFMDSTLRVYGDLLNQYLVAVPPSQKPAFVPDEFALIAVESEAAYQQVRGTPEGKAYGESHWNLFSRESSRSAPYSAVVPGQLEHNKAYDLVGTPVDWKSGHAAFFIGLRKPGISSESFLTRLSSHVRLAAGAFRPKGLKGYLVIANENYEAAYMNWESAEAMRAAFATEAGAQAQRDAGEIMDMLQWSEAEAFGAQVAPGKFYKTLR